MFQGLDMVAGGKHFLAIPCGTGACGVCDHLGDPAICRTFAAYGGIYFAASLAWMWTVEGVTPTGFDLGRAGLVLCGAG